MAIIAAGIPGLSMAAGCLLSPKQNISLPKKKLIRRQPIIPPPTRKVFSLLFRQDKWWQWKLTIPWMSRSDMSPHLAILPAMSLSTLLQKDSELYFVEI